MNKYEQLIEHIINDEQDKARALFHKIVVEKSRDIYESLIDEDDLQEVGGNEVESLVRDVEVEEEGIAEADMDDEGAEGPDMDMDDMDMDDMGDEDDHHDDVGGDEGLEDRVMDLEDALDELKAEFDSLMAGDDSGDEDMGMDDMDMAGDDDAMRMMEAEDEEEEDDEEELDENMVREYVEKVSAPSMGSEGHEVAKGGSANVNKQSIVANKNDMGGSAKNLVRGDSNPAPDGQKPNGKAAGFVKPAQEMDLGKRNVNKPGGNKGAQNFYNSKETSWEKSHGKEGQTTSGKMSVDSKSIVGGKVR